MKDDPRHAMPALRLAAHNSTEALRCRVLLGGASCFLRAGAGAAGAFTPDRRATAKPASTQTAGKRKEEAARSTSHRSSVRVISGVHRADACGGGIGGARSSAAGDWASFGASRCVPAAVGHGLRRATDADGRIGLAKYSRRSAEREGGTRGRAGRGLYRG